MKKLLSTFMLLFAASLTFALTLPTGQETAVRDSKTENGKIVAVVLAAPVSFKTFFGDVEAKANTRVDFYESGAIKSFYSDAHCDVSTSAGDFKLTTFHSSRPGVGVPFEFYENGKLKSAFFSRQAKPVVKTQLGTLSAMTATKITFFENGAVESFAISPNQKIAFKNLTGSYVQQKTLSFYENGSVKSLTSNAEETYAPLGIKTKKSTEITFSESGNMVSFTPADNATVKIGENMFLLCRGKEFKLFDNGGIQQCTFDCSNQDFTIGNTLFAYKTVTEEVGSTVPVVPTAYLTVIFSENGTLLSAEADRVAAHLDAYPIVGGIGDNLWSAKKIEFYDDGTLKSVSYMRELRLGKRVRDVFGDANFKKQGFANIIVPSPYELNISKKNTSYDIWKIYYSKDGGTQYLIGWERFESPKSNFYDENKSGVFTVKAKSVVESIFLDDINADSNLIFDESGKPVAYTTTAPESDAVIQKPLKK